MTKKLIPMPNALKTHLLFWILLCGTHLAFSQKDTEFWFVAPEIAQGNNNYDRPVAFRFSTYGTPATVTVSQPANPAFPVQTITIAANASGILEFPPFFDMVENTPANTVLNKGFLIESTSPISVYYEIMGQYFSNPDIFALKGRNALGNQFYIPFQSILDNSDAYLPLPHAAFDIVATEDNTVVTILPSKAIVGHAANTAFSITLNRGQTYSAQAASQLADQHPTGSKVVSDKPIAITIKDDLLDAAFIFGGFCRDLMGDQIVPVEKVGTRYVLQKGLLNGAEPAFVVAISDGTIVKYDGVPVATLLAGQTLQLNVTDRHYLETSAPVYVWQMSGNSCEVAGAIIPTLDCSGSSSVRFVRTTSETFYLFLVTRSGNEGGFKLNGNASLIQASDFQVVPGSNGEFVSATISVSDFDVPSTQSSIVENNLGVFQLGFLNGASSGTGCRFGFFSDFGNQVTITENVTFCPGQSVQVYGMTIDTPGVYQQTHTNPQGCDTLIEITAVFAPTDTTLINTTTCDTTQAGIFVQVLTNSSGCDSVVITTVSLLPTIHTLTEISLCPNDTIVLGGVAYSQPGTVTFSIPSTSGGCDTLATYTLLAGDQPVLLDSIALCPNDTIVLNGVAYSQPGTVIFTIPSTSGGCDTMATYVIIRADNVLVSDTIVFCSGDSVLVNGVYYSQADTAIAYTLPASIGCDTLVEVFLQYAPQPAVTKVIAFCPGDSVQIGGTFYNQPGTISGIIAASAGCDTLATYILQFSPQPTATKTIAFCLGESVVIDGVSYIQPDTVLSIIPATSGCDTVVTYFLEYALQPMLSKTIEFCKGQSVVVNGTTYNQPALVMFTIPSLTGGCDTLATYTLQYLVPTQPTTITLNCPNNIFVDADPGQTSVPVTYALPTAATDCPCPGLSLSLQQGLASGSNFPVGINDVCYAAKDSCGKSITCCFKVTVQEVTACDIKEINCIRYELVSITQDAQQRKTYRIRTVNNCTNRMIYMAIQAPDGLPADLPVNNSTYTALSGRTYLVRNPNYSPFFSTRFSSVSDSIHNGESDVFQYTLPPQANPTFIHVLVKLEPQIYYEAHLNVFNCIVEYEANKQAAQRDATNVSFGLFPIPTDGTLFADLSDWEGQDVQLRVINAQGQLILLQKVAAGSEAQDLNLPEHLAGGLYLLEVTPANGLKQTKRFVVQH